MALQTFNPPVPPSPGTDIKPEMKINRAEFGDGYTQEQPAGLNHLRRVVTLQWDVLTIEQAAAIEAFFEAHGGYQPFHYALSDDVQRKWTCDTWGLVRGTPNTFTATFRESFALLS
jgi:phage-related protein